SMTTHNRLPPSARLRVASVDFKASFHRSSLPALCLLLLLFAVLQERSFSADVPVIPAAADAQGKLSTNLYTYHQQHDHDGIGKFYCGREIALVMGHEAAPWLERPERNQEENTDLLVQSLDLKPGIVIADIGAGTGYLSRRMAAKVGPAG